MLIKYNVNDLYKENVIDGLVVLYPTITFEEDLELECPSIVLEDKVGCVVGKYNAHADYNVLNNIIRVRLAQELAYNVI